MYLTLIICLHISIRCYPAHVYSVRHVPKYLLSYFPAYSLLTFSDAKKKIRTDVCDKVLMLPPGYVINVNMTPARTTSVGSDL